jgi:DNA-3-methyladenine glycosylase I
MARLSADNRTADDWTEDGRPRCGWATGPWLVPYHDEEWGVPVHDDRQHFEFLVLEGAQAGLSWLTILKRRDGYRRAFADFDPAKVARFTEKRAEALMGNAGIIRNRQKIHSTIGNAGHFLAVQEEHGSFDDYLWGFVDGQPVVNRWPAIGHVPATSAVSDAVSADLRRRGFRFVGSTIVYAHLQAVGVVNDHLTTCFRYDELAG